MSPSEIAGWIGAGTGVVSLCWNIYVKVSSGFKLRVSAWGNKVLYPAPPNNPRLLDVAIRNVGTVPITVTNLTFHDFKSKRAAKKQDAEFNAVVKDFYMLRYPFPLKLEVGDEWRGQVEQGGPLDKLIQSHSLWVAIHHSFSNKPTQAKVITGPFIEPSKEHVRSGEA